MPDEIPWKDEINEPATYIRYKGIWDMQDMYETIANFFRLKKYDFYERVYKHKHPSPFGVEREYVWEAEKQENEFIHFIYDVYIHTYDAHDVEVVMPDNHKKIYTKGRIWIELKAKVITDKYKRWQKKSFYSSLKSFYGKYLLKENFAQGWVPKIRYEMYELHSMLKARLKMEADEYEHANGAGVNRRF